MNVIPVLLEGIFYLYKSCQIDKVRESCSVWILKFLILIIVEPSTLVWIDIGKSLNLSNGLRLTVDKDELLSRVNYLLWIRISLQDWDLCNRIWFFYYYPTCSKFELGKDTGLIVLEVASRRTSVRSWIDMCHDLGRVRKWPLQIPPLLPSLWKSLGTLPRGL